MRISRIAKMGKEDKFAVFVDDKLEIILTGQSLLDSGLGVGDELSKESLDKIKAVSSEHQFYNQALKYINLRLRSESELKQYLKRKGASPEQINFVINRLKTLDLINDENYARAFIHDRLMVTPASKRKITFELRKKQIAEDIITRSLDNGQINDLDSLEKLIEIKRRQTKYKDSLKLMQYLVRIGFNYSDVKQVINKYNA